MSVARIIGVWNDGSAYDVLEKVPRDARTVLRVQQGGSFRAILSILTPAGILFELVVGDVLVLTVRRKPQDGVNLLKLTGVLKPTLGKNVAEFTITPAQTKGLDFGRYVYDVWVTKTSTSERNQVIGVSAFVLEPGVLPPT